ncbi:MAG TPA: hypothetical protein VN782_15755 [Usitatibacter sp.]|nr:hypothetical protein [Usitatibacter sp.]
MNAFLRQPTIASLAVLAAILVAAIGLETGFGTRLGPTIPAGVSKRAVPNEAKLLPAPAPIDPATTYTEMVARPLFTPTRRPAPAAEPAAEASFKRGQYVLQGVIIAAGMKIAMLREKATGKVHRVEEGHDLAGMKLAEVKPDSVTLAAGKEQEVLPLQVLKQPAAAGAATPEGPFSAHVGPRNPAAPPPPNAPAHAPEPAFGPPREAPAQNPEPGALPQATTRPLTPEELLARRRARRAQQEQ